MRTRIATWTRLLCLTLSVIAVAAKKESPDIEPTSFKSLPANIFYFDDSDTVLVTDIKPGIVYRSTDAGVKWRQIKEIGEGKIGEVFSHPYDPKAAIAIGNDKTHWITKDRGESWTEFKTKYEVAPGRALSFHADDPDRMIIGTLDCHGSVWGDCTPKSYYTLDGFKDIELLHDKAVSCLWAKSTDLFTTGDDKLDKDQVLCVVEGKYSTWQKDNRLVMSSDFFEKQEVEPTMSEGRTVPGVVNVAAVKGYIAVAAKSEGTTELAMYVTDDAKTWHRAEFGKHKLEENAYTLLESTNYSIQVDLMASSITSPMGALFTSNSNGTYFTKSIEHTNRNIQGYVDFEKIQNIQGIVLVNVVDNWQELEKDFMADKKIKSKISFDDGRVWHDLKVGKEDLHLHSVTDQRNIGRVFSSPAPGIVMGIGNTGKYLKSFEEGDTFVSDDAGLTWRLALEGPHLYEMGDQGAILVAVEDTDTKEIKWSIDHGKKWDSVKLDDKIRPIVLLTVPDSTSLKFILVASKGSGSKLEHFTYSLDFNGLHEDKCKDSDFEKWAARVDDDGKPSCIMGHKQFFRRRKADADCFVDVEFKDPQPEYEDCKCTDADYECDYNFERSEDGKECVPTGSLKAPEGACKNPEDEYEGSSGYRLIPGNTCDKKDGVAKDKPVKRPCKDTAAKPPASGKISHEIKKFKGAKFAEYYYLEKAASASGDDETIIMRTDRREVFISHDGGKTWDAVLPDEEIVSIYPHQYNQDTVYLITPSKKVFYSANRGYNIHHFEAPEEPNQDRVQILSFHPSQPDWLIWTGGKDCKGFGEDCHSVAHVTKKNGEDWTTLLRFVRKCQFVAREDRSGSDSMVFCEQYQDEDPSKPLQLISSDDWYEHKEVHFEDVISFATMSEFMVVALRDKDGKTLRVDTSIDGKTFANAQFPKNFKVPHQQAYTVLDSSTHAIFLHVTVNNREGQEYGSIVKSNSNGTSYVMSIGQVNRNTPGYVDFEKMQGLEGVAVVNIVSNVEEVDGGASKKLKTMITHNDGAEWGLITPPKKDTDNKDIDCSGDLEKCSLHLHGYTERKDPRDTYSSPSAVGLMMAVGNVGPSLGPYKEGNTFITRDGGVEWHEVFKGTYMWEYGDQGSIIVIVQEGVPVDTVYYTTNEGQKWIAYQFSETKVLVDHISTVPSDTSRNFILWGKDGGSSGGLVTVNLDFSGLTDRQCKLDENVPDASDSDYDLWEPKHPLSDSNCLFGHIAQYHRKKPEADCYNGPVIDRLHAISQNCSCSRQDFECDYNYERQNDGSCALVPGTQPIDPLEYCAANPDLDEYYAPTGYRRIPLTTCSGGKEFDKISEPYPCPNHEKQFEKKHGISGAGLFFAIVIPIMAAAGVGYYVYKNYDGQFGRIQLGDTGMMGNGNGAFDSEQVWIKYPVAALSAVVAVLAAVPMVIGGLFRMASQRFGGGSGGGYSRPYTSRSSFSRGRGDYSHVDADEGELLGDESDEEV
ncbi:Oligoxyloglucan reducing end-specific cellobiohydrolase [Aureobasidium pullulans]|nr:Oligoxyloglucan reducing end-specific cellobiohydrolase [Aureobasidium pullulans]